MVSTAIAPKSELQYKCEIKTNNNKKQGQKPTSENYTYIMFVMQIRLFT